MELYIFALCIFFGLEAVPAGKGGTFLILRGRPGRTTHEIELARNKKFPFFHYISAPEVFLKHTHTHIFHFHYYKGFGGEHFEIYLHILK